MRAVALLATLLLFLRLASGKKFCPPAINRKSPVPGMRNSYRLSVFHPACESVYSAFTSIYTPTHSASSTSSAASPSSTPASPAQPPFVVDGFEAYFGNFRGDLNISVTFCPSPADDCVPGPPFQNQTVLTNCTDECWMAVAVPGGQQVYVSPQGIVGFSDFGLNGSDIPPGSYTTGFQHVPGNPGYWNFTGTNNNSSGFVFCENFKGQTGLFADVPGLDCGLGCFCQPGQLNVTTTDFTGAYRVYAYNGSSHNCVTGLCLP